MKKVMLLSGIVLSLLHATAQEGAQKTTMSKRWMKKEGARIVNQFQLAVKKLADCPLFIMDGTLELFSDNAFIQVSSLKSHQPKVYAPEDYFRIVNALKCGSNPVYQNMSFDYLPVSARNASTCFDGNCTFSYDITQIFRAELKNGKKVWRKAKGDYCDVTIKRVNVYFRVDHKGVLEGKIIGILVEKTEKCEGNGMSNTISNL